MKTFRCFKQIDVTRLVILLCFALLLLAVTTHRSRVVYRVNIVQSTSYRYAIIQNTEMTACTKIDNETIKKLANDDDLRKRYFSKLATSIADEFRVTVRAVEIRDNNEICVLYINSSTKQIPKGSRLARFY